MFEGCAKRILLWVGFLLGLWLPQPVSAQVTASPLSEADRLLLEYDPDDAKPAWPNSNRSKAERRFSSDPDRTSVQREVAVAVLRHLFRHNESALQGRAARYCVDVLGRRAPRRVLRALADVRPQVVATRECPSGPVVFFRVGSIKLIDGAHAEASGGYYEGSLSSSGHSYWITKSENRWVVVGDRMNYIS